MDAGNMLKPMLARGELHMVGATTLDEYRKHIEKDAALERRFQPVLVDQPSVEDTISILRGLKERYETHHGVRITDGAIVAAAMLSDRYITDRFLPDKAIDLIDEAAARLRMEITSDPQRARRPQAAHDAAGDRARGAEEGKGRRQQGAAGAAGAGAGQSARAAQRARGTAAARARASMRRIQTAQGADRQHQGRDRARRSASTITTRPPSCSTAR